MYILRKRKENDGEPPSDIGRSFKPRVIVTAALIFTALTAGCLMTIQPQEQSVSLSVYAEGSEPAAAPSEEHPGPDEPKAEALPDTAPASPLDAKPPISCVTAIDLIQAGIQAAATAQDAQAGAAPASTEPSTAPESAEAAAAPENTEGDAATQSTEASAAPESTEVSAAPESTEAGTAPASTEAGAASDSLAAGVTTDAAKSSAYNPSIPLDSGLQQYLYDLCVQRNLDYKTVLAVILHESSFRADALGGGSNYGLFQINVCHHKSLSALLKTKNAPFDPKTNMNWGTYLLSCLYVEYVNTYSGEELDKAVLSAYNRGDGGFKKYGFAEKYIKEHNKALGVVNSWFA